MLLKHFRCLEGGSGSEEAALDNSLNSQTFILDPLSLLSSLSQSHHFLFSSYKYSLIPHPLNSLRTPEGFPLNCRSGTMSFSQRVLKAESHHLFLFVLIARKLKAS